MLPSDPAVILEGKVFAEGKGNSVILPDVVIRPMDDPTGPISVNQRSPSGPAVILPGTNCDGGSAYSWKMPLIPWVEVGVGEEPDVFDGLHALTKPARKSSSTISTL